MAWSQPPGSVWDQEPGAGEFGSHRGAVARLWSPHQTLETRPKPRKRVFRQFERNRIEEFHSNLLQVHPIDSNSRQSCEIHKKIWNLSPQIIVWIWVGRGFWGDRGVVARWWSPRSQPPPDAGMKPDKFSFRVL